MAGKLAGKVVVITGASSGIGRATAVAFARQGATVVLAARRETALHEVADEVIAAGGRAMVVPTDVRDPVAVKRLADRAIEAFGRVDIWINNAGVASFGKFEETPAESFAAVLDTTFGGVANGFRAILPHFRERRSGIILTTASIVGRVATPYQSAYNAAKHAVMGFTETVRQEIELDGFTGIHVCNVLPGPVDTPFWQHAANYSGRDVQALPGTVTPEKVASALMSLALNPRRELGVGASPHLMEFAMALAPGMVERRLGRATRDRLFQNSTRPRTDGALLRPMPEFTGADAGWRERLRRQSGGRTGTAAYAGILALTLPIAAAAYYRYGRRH